jgi:hypothetical protein
MLSALAVLLAVVLLVIFFFWQRSWRAQVDSRPPDAGPTRPASTARVDTRARRDQEVSPGRDFDSDATLVYGGPGGSHAAVPRPRRENTAPLAGAQLVGLNGSHRGRHFPIAERGITIGRNPSCDVVLADARVSSRHAWIGIVEGKAILRDLDSTNGTYLNAQTHSPVSEVELHNGDTVFFGGHQGDQFRFVAE